MWFILLLLLPFSAHSDEDLSSEEIQAYRQEIERSYQLELGRLKDRYQGFFDMLEDKAKKDKERLQGVKRLKEQRELWALEQEKSRVDYVLNRKPKPDPELSPGAKRHAEWLERQKAVYEKQRELFVLKRTRLQDVRESSQQVPENKDVGLE